MASVNKVIIVGNVGRDPDVKNLASGGLVANFSVATSDKYRDSKSNELQQKTEWHRISAWGKLAEIVQKYLKSGAQVYIEGRLVTSKYQKNGVDQYSTTVVAEVVQFLSKNNSLSSDLRSDDANSEPNTTWATVNADDPF